MKIGSFTLIKNEARFIQAHLDSWTPCLDELVFFDGGSTDGTLEILKADKSGKVKVYEGKDPANMAEAYEAMSNDCLRSLTTDLAMFLHPDMLLESPGDIKNLPKDIIAGTFTLKTFAGEPDGDIYQVVGRSERWKDIYRLHNPDLGAHYHGHYGVFAEDVYFSEITGSAHQFHALKFEKYPYPIHHSTMVVRHYSDVRPYSRRLERMERCLINQGYPIELAKKIAPTHPRVSLVSGGGLEFIKIEKPDFLKKGIK